MKYRVEVGAHVTRYVGRHLTVYADSETEACKKALLKWDKIERAIPSCVDPGEPRVDDIEEVKS